LPAASRPSFWQRVSSAASGSAGHDGGENTDGFLGVGLTQRKGGAEQHEPQQTHRAKAQDHVRVHPLAAGAVQNLPNTQAQTSSLLASSQSSVGILQATQAGNQLVAVQTRQLADLTALLAAQGRSQALEAARKVEAEGQAQEQFRRFLSNGQGYQPQTVQMFH
jgi:P-type conjugative transfer protein TrbJ